MGADISRVRPHREGHVPGLGIPIHQRVKQLISHGMPLSNNASVLTWDGGVY